MSEKIVAAFDLAGMSQAEYDNIVATLTANGQIDPSGRLYHVAANKGGEGWFIVEVWESAAALAAFSETLKPAFQKAGVQLVETEVYPVYEIRS